MFLVLLWRLFVKLEFNGINFAVGEGFGKAYVGVKDPNGRTALHLAAAAGKTEICDHLIKELKLDVNERDDEIGKEFFMFLIFAQYYCYLIFDFVEISVFNFS